jgi:hypothetical protein
MLMLRYHQRGQELSALCVTGCVGLLLAPVSWVPCWVWIAPIVVALFSWLQATWRDCGLRRVTTRERRTCAGAVIAVALGDHERLILTHPRRARMLPFAIVPNPGHAHVQVWQTAPSMS